MTSRRQVRPIVLSKTCNNVLLNDTVSNALTDCLVVTGLAQAKLLILTEPDIPTEGQTAIVKWMKGGGHVMTTTGAGASLYTSKSQSHPGVIFVNGLNRNINYRICAVHQY